MSETSHVRDLDLDTAFPPEVYVNLEIKSVEIRETPPEYLTEGRDPEYLSLTLRIVDWDEWEETFFHKIYFKTSFGKRELKKLWKAAMGVPLQSGSIDFDNLADKRVNGRLQHMHERDEAGQLIEDGDIISYKVRGTSWRPYVDDWEPPEIVDEDSDIF